MDALKESVVIGFQVVSYLFVSSIIMTSSRTTQQDTSEPSRMWPVDYILNSAYSPLRVETQLPSRNWRDAFEDLLALESKSEMISWKSRLQEKNMALRIHRGVATHLLHLTDRALRDNVLFEEQVQEARREFELWGVGHQVSRIDNEILPRLKLVENFVIQKCKALSQTMESASQFPASHLKGKGQWIASLISSGVLPGWSSRVEISTWPDGPHFSMRKSTDPPQLQSDDKDRIDFTEKELRLRFAKPDSAQQETHAGEKSPLEMAARPASSKKLPPFPGLVPSGRDLVAQTIRSERVRLPNGSTANKVVLTHHSADGKEEKVEIVDDAAEVLDKVEKARLLMDKFSPFSIYVEKKLSGINR